MRSIHIAFNKINLSYSISTPQTFIPKSQDYCLILQLISNLFERTYGFATIFIPFEPKSNLKQKNIFTKLQRIAGISLGKNKPFHHILLILFFMWGSSTNIWIMNDILIVWSNWYRSKNDNSQWYNSFSFGSDFILMSPLHLI